MKRAIKSTRPGLVGTGVVLLSLIAAARSTIAAHPNGAIITRIVNEVQLHAAQTAPHSASVNDKVADGSSVQTGMDSRTELTFADQVLARLSASTIFSFDEGTRNLDLASGAMLLRVPKAAGGVVTINSAQQADVFTNNPNYFGFGGTGAPASSGTFGSVGAKNPQPLANAPPLGDPGQGP